MLANVLIFAIKLSEPSLFVFLVFRSYHSCKENACIMRLDELSCEVRLEQRTTKGSSS